MAVMTGTYYLTLNEAVSKLGIEGSIDNYLPGLDMHGFGRQGKKHLTDVRGIVASYIKSLAKSFPDMSASVAFERTVYYLDGYQDACLKHGIGMK